MTSRVRLRAVRRDDSQLLFDWINDRELRLFNAPYRPISEPEHERWLNNVLTRHTDLIFFIIERTDTSEAVGTCQLLRIDHLHRNAELQIRIGPANSRGLGLGQEALKRLCDIGFRDLNLHRIQLYVFASNARAINAYVKSGFVEEGLLRDAVFLDGRFEDVVLMARLAPPEAEPPIARAGEEDQRKYR